MRDTDKLILVILGRSIESEDAGMEFYEELATKTSAPEGRELFSRLAREEREHEAEMREKYNEIATRCGWEPYEGAASYKFLDHIAAELPFLSEDGLSFDDKKNLAGAEALRFAIDVEKASANYFMKAAIAIDQIDAKMFFTELARTELNHAQILEKEMSRFPRA
ncbi:MAG: ferritin family protein [Planctomycetota bacterium]|jgi:rubrerythrin|nr:ferritin family protein [Planctomycetota bacterium]